MFWVTGDTHFPLDFPRVKAAIKQEKIKDGDSIIICGDGGFVWDGTKKEHRNISKLAYDFPNINFLYLDGNHENFDLLSRYKIETLHDGKVQRIGANLYHLMRGEIYTIENKKVWVMGGAQSIDKQWRTPGLSWWTQEIPTMEEFEYGLARLDSVDNKVDIILSHAAPLSIAEKILPNTVKLQDPMCVYFEHIKLTTQFDNWYFGHYHQNITVDGKFHCLYDSIVELI